MSSTTDTARNANLQDLAAILGAQQSRKLDIVAPAGAIRSEGGVLYVAGAEQEITLEGVTTVDGAYRPTLVCDEGIAEMLGVPVAYLKKLRAERPDIYDANVNGWLQGGTWDGGVAGNDQRSFMVRTFRPDDQGGEGVARAFLSDRYRTVDNLDVLTAALEGVKAAGVAIDIAGCDLTDRRMYVRIVAPEVKALAPTLLANYRRPWAAGQAPWETVAGRDHGWLTPDDQPTVFAGFELSNSETGGGAFTIVPRLVVQVCSNGLKVTADAIREVHIGGQLDAGVIRWSEDTQRKNLELVTARTADAVATFLDVDYMTTVIERLEENSAKPLNTPAETIKVIGQKLRFTQERTASILDHFIKGGDATAGGVLQAVTSYAQEVADADEAAELEGVAMRAFDLAVAAR